MAVRLGVLGPLQIRSGDEVVLPRRRMARLVLGVLALRPNAALPVGWLIDCLWNGRPPASAAANLRTYVTELRRLLRSGRGDGPGDPDDPCIEAGQGRYALRVGPDRLDALRFDLLLDGGRRDLAGGRSDRAADQLRTALALWRGPVLEALPVPEALQQEVRVLESRRLAAVEEWMEARLAVGEHTAAAVELGGLVEQHPLRERLWEQLMRGLYASGRQGEALAAYQRLYALLDTELGVRPGPSARELHGRMLRGEPLPARLRAPIVGGGSRPHELPAEPAVFVGRDAELAELGRLAGAGVTVAISGTAGVGKTALALRWAHRAAGEYPDGALYVDLRGFGPNPPLTPAGVLAGFLRGLGADPAELPQDADQLAGQYRTRLAGRRLLIVLDNAGSADQVRPLLPGASGSQVIVTSRDSLAGLVARDGVHRLDLDRLPRPAALRLFGQLVGRPGAAAVAGADAGVDAGVDAAAVELVELCVRLPLALRIAAELAVSRRGTPLPELVAELRAGQLDALAAGGDPATAVRAVLSWSYRHLPVAAARAFRLIGLHPGRELDAYAVAALAGATLPEARELIGTLARGHLVEPAGSGRFRQHDLLRAYAAELAAADPERAGALDRLLDYCLAATSAAMDGWAPYERDRRPRVPPATTPVPAFPEATAGEWLDAERANLIAVALAIPDPRVGALAATLHRYLDTGGWYVDALAVHTAAVALAAGPERARALCDLGVIHWRVEDYPAALDHYQRALSLARDRHDRTTEIRALNNVGLVHEHLGEYDAAVGCYQQVVAVARDIGDRPGEARGLDNLGNVTEYLGRYAEALDHKRQALAIARDIGDRGGAASTLNNLGNAYERLGRYEEALAYFQEALAIAREVGYRELEGHALDNVGIAYRRLGDLHRALDQHRQAIVLARDTANNHLLAEALISAGETLRGLGDPAAAAERGREALAVAGALGDPRAQARAHDGLGDARAALGDPAAARTHWGQALALYTSLGAPEAPAVAAKLG
jgi:DNA-binding SARP family transcriptional activator/Tfp pilus assembly protein PilF